LFLDFEERGFGRFPWHKFLKANVFRLLRVGLSDQAAGASAEGDFRTFRCQLLRKPFPDDLSAQFHRNYHQIDEA
jgi:hypothetical protein